MRCPNCAVELKTRAAHDLDIVFEECPKCEFVTAKNHIRVNEIWAFLSVDPNSDNEGIPAIDLGKGMIMPMVAADPERVESLKGTAEKMAKRAGIKIRLVKFSMREEVEVFE